MTTPYGGLVLVPLALSLLLLPQSALLVVGRRGWRSWRALLAGFAAGAPYGAVPALASAYGPDPGAAALSVAVVLFVPPASLFLVPDRMSIPGASARSLPLAPVGQRVAVAGGITLGAWSAVLAVLAVRGQPYGT